MTTDEFRDRLAGVREGLDNTLSALNELDEHTWDEVDEGDVYRAATVRGLPPRTAVAEAAGVSTDVAAGSAKLVAAGIFPRLAKGR